LALVEVDCSVAIDDALMREAPHHGVPPNEIRILDVIRGRTFSLDRMPLRGDEEVEFRRRYSELLRQREALRWEYD
jgi:hypothetical protein